MNDLRQEKERCRGVLRARLAGMTAAQRATESRAVCRAVARLEPVARAAAIVLYRALSSEVDMADLASEAARRGQGVYYPALTDRPGALRFLAVTSATTWRRTALGFEEPAAGDELPSATIAEVVLVVPGLGFTARGERIGRGQGYYDRVLAEPSWQSALLRVGVAFEVQVIEALPMGPLDQRVGAVVTASKTWFGGLPLRAAT